MSLHGLVGAVLVIIALCGLIETLGHVASSRLLRVASPLVAGAGGVLVLVYIALRQWLNAGRVSDSNTAHWVIAAALVLSGMIVGTGRNREPWALAQETAGPFASIIIGAMFFVHVHRSDGQHLLHLSIAATLGLSALAHLSAILGGEGSRGLRVFAALLMAVAGLQLIFYDARSAAAPSAAKPVTQTVALRTDLLS